MSCILLVSDAEFCIGRLEDLLVC